MRNGIITIMKKELARFFGDRRMVVSILMPGVLLYIMYSFMGTAMGMPSAWMRIIRPLCRR